MCSNVDNDNDDDNGDNEGIGEERFRNFIFIYKYRRWWLCCTMVDNGLMDVDDNVGAMMIIIECQTKMPKN